MRKLSIIKKPGAYLSALLVSVFSLQLMAQTIDEKSSEELVVNSRIEKTNINIHESLEFVESDLADLVVSENKKFLDDPDVRIGLGRMTKARRDQVDNTEATVSKAFDALHRSLKLTPGVMDREALMNRALLIRDVAGYYDKHDPAMCRYLPGDFNVLLNIDMPWLTDADDEILKKSISDEKKSIVLMLNGVLPVDVNDSDKAIYLSKYVTRWFSALPASDSYLIGKKRLDGNYCLLWSSLLNEVVSASEVYPRVVEDILSPLLLTSSRGWLDSGLWAVRQTIQEDKNNGENYE